ncbi:hypothetical protein [Streptomyces yaizuensis]|uniref:Sugar transferase n=1 Tax=Streptomyces yaizuensis TaxID=2989713 RepID=A0AA86M9E3_9ACTN|nr:hypothetical protein [Streptomyces sp. YSPA8]BDT39535.1 sugar transferase [Streptomyces sp. YSPA8]
MASTDWLSYGCTEIVNTARARAYAAAYGVEIDCEPCPSLEEALWGTDPDWQGYSTPAGDDAPWFDPAVPESGRFLGIIGIQFQGLANNPVERTVIPRIGDGSFVGALRRTHREINLTLLLVGADECALSWGMAWLAATLRGTACAGSGCTGDELCFFTCCPCADPLPYDEVGQREIRHLLDVGLVGGPDENDRYTVPGTGCTDSAGLCGDPMVSEVSITLAAGRPWFFHTPVPAGGQEWNYITRGTLVRNYDPDADDCPKIPDCLRDPTCAPLPALPTVPVPVDPCYPRGRFNAWRMRFAYSPVEVTEWLELVPVLFVETGAKALRRLSVRFIPNPNNVPCQELGSCNACGHLVIAYLPPNATLTLDGRVSRAWVDCPSPNGSATSSPNLFGRRGGAFSWPALECGGSMCVEVYAGADADDGARVRMELVPRSDLT